VGGGRDPSGDSPPLSRTHPRSFRFVGMLPDLSRPFPLAPDIFSSSGVICGCVIIHGFDGIFFPESPQ
jgi:hypothetical protein